MIEVRKGDPAEPEARALLEASHALMTELFNPEDNHFLSIEALQAPGIAFFVAQEGSTTLGTGALATKEGYGEIKSMFTASAARGKGVATAILDAIEAEARSNALPVLKLETGDLLTDAQRLYAKVGFAICDRFGDYPMDGKHSVFMEKWLD